VHEVGDSVPLSFTIWIGKRATTSGGLPHTATIRSLVCSREMRPLAFLDPSALIRTYATTTVAAGTDTCHQSTRIWSVDDAK